MYNGKEMRQVFGETLCKLAAEDSRIVVLEADLMKASGTTPFKEAFPDRFFDVGVAEANMIGIAAGLANMGKIPFATSFTPFATRRAFDQNTISVAYAYLPVRIGGTDPGVTAELNGGTHMSFEDAGIMRGLANMIVVEPVDSHQLVQFMTQSLDMEEPVYMRMHRKLKETLFSKSDTFTIGRNVTIREGTDGTIIASGIMVPLALEAADTLEKEGIKPRVVNMHTLKPVDKQSILSAARDTGAIVTAENHSIINGWGSAVAEVLCEEHPVPLRRIGVRDHFGEVGKVPFLLEKYEMTTTDIAQALRDVLKKRG